jgi:hypothetical protein
VAVSFILKECFKNECLFDTDNTYVLFTKLIDISRSELIAKILVDIIEEDKQNDIGSIVFVTRTHSFLKHSFNFCLANIVGKLDFIPISLLNNPKYVDILQRKTFRLYT